MPFTVEQAIAQVIRDGDPARGLLGLDALENWGLYDDATASRRRIFIGEEPTQPDAVATVILEGGAPPVEGAYGIGIGRRPSFTIRLRDAAGQAVSDRAFVVYQLLDEFEGDVNGVPFFRVNANTEPVPLGRDRESEGGRWVWSQSFRSVTKRYSLA